MVPGIVRRMQTAKVTAVEATMPTRRKARRWARIMAASRVEDMLVLTGRRGRPVRLNSKTLLATMCWSKRLERAPLARSS